VHFTEEYNCILSCVTTGWRRRAKQTFEQSRKPVELSVSVGDECNQRLDIEVQFESTINA
jgi:hypothetical protein